MNADLNLGENPKSGPTFKLVQNFEIRFIFSSLKEDVDVWTSLKRTTWNRWCGRKNLVTENYFRKFNFHSRYNLVG